MGDKQTTGKQAASCKRYGLWASCGLTLLILVAWHFLDVRAGILGTEETWLYGWCGGFYFLAALTAGGLGYAVFTRKQWKLGQISVASVISLGLLFLFALPPLLAPNEVGHFISVYQLPSHIAGKTANAHDGQVLLRAQDVFIEDLYDVMETDRTGFRERGGEQQKIVVLGQELGQDIYHAVHDQGIRGAHQEREGEEMEETAVSYQPPVRTTLLIYVPQALGITLARLMGLGDIGFFYMGRLFNLLSFMAMDCFTIRRVPFGKEMAFGVYLFPMTLHLTASSLYDMMIISLSGYFATACLHLAYEVQRVKIRDVVLLALIMAVMGPCKMVHDVVVDSCSLIPVRESGGWGRWAVSAAVVLGAFGAAMLAVNSRTVAMYTKALGDHIAWAEETGYTLAQLVHSPLLVFRICCNTLMWQGEELYPGMLGESLGNIDAVLNIPYMSILGPAAILLMLVSRKLRKCLIMTMANRTWIWLLCFLCLEALMFSILLAWTPVTSGAISGVQGRYLLPPLPIFLLTPKNSRVVRTDCSDEPLLYVMAVMDLYVVLRIFSIVHLQVPWSQWVDRFAQPWIKQVKYCRTVDKVIKLPDGHG